MLDEKARELGRLIGQSSEYQAVKRANDALNNDRDAVALLRKMDQLRDEAMARTTARSWLMNRYERLCAF